MKDIREYMPQEKAATAGGRQGSSGRISKPLSAVAQRHRRLVSP